MNGSLYNTLKWRAARARALRRDGNACQVARLFGGRCSPGPLHVHHLTPVAEGGALYDLANLVSVCSAHHPLVEAFRRAVLRSQGEAGWRRCPHYHRSPEGRRLCEARLNRARQAA